MAESRTGANTHRAIERGYAKGQLIEPGQMVPAGVVVSDRWMESLTKKEARMAEAIEQALDPQPDDVEIQNLSREALEAMAAERGIDPKGLTKKLLVDAIKANRDNTR